MLCNGIGTEKDVNAGAEYLNKAAKTMPYACIALAKLYISGEIGGDLNVAVSLLNKAKSINNSTAPLVDYTLGSMYLFIDKVRDVELARKYLTDSANAGNEYAQNLLDSRTSWEQGCVVKLVGSVGRLLSENLESSRAAMAECSAAVFGHGDLSKEQIRELILKKQDKENTAEM